MKTKETADSAKPKKGKAKKNHIVFESQMPHIFSVENTGDTEETIQLFGSDGNKCKEHFGSSEAIKFSHYDNDYFGGGKDGYRAMLSYLERNPFICGRIRVQCTNTEQLKEEIVWNISRPSGGRQCQKTEFKKKPGQYVETAMETDVTIPIFGSTVGLYKLAPKTVVTFFVWAREKFVFDNILLGKEPKVTYSEPEPWATSESEAQDPASEPNEGNANSSTTSEG